MLILLHRQPEAKALLTFVSSVIILILSANSILIPTCIWTWISSSLLCIVLYFIPIILLMRWFARGGQYSDIHTANLDGQTFLITGAGGGIGKETAVELAKRGARVILFARSTNLSEAVIDVKKVARSPNNVTGYSLDLADLRSIIVCVEQFMKNENE
jgi:lactate dehydrogenase-like 2-hydroxyacid dehydrogenase